MQFTLAIFHSNKDMNYIAMQALMMHLSLHYFWDAILFKTMPSLLIAQSAIADNIFHIFLLGQFCGGADPITNHDHKMLLAKMAGFSPRISRILDAQHNYDSYDSN